MSQVSNSELGKFTSTRSPIYRLLLFILSNRSLPQLLASSVFSIGFRRLSLKFSSFVLRRFELSRMQGASKVKSNAAAV
ncbi:unnamed protein product [Lactuca virosa]|uniref:Uncharacterized protein n=1 Tax=Lactuca virosa TaxID=75947 RepID=A0AAU9NU19_9ASTR|nr:unnamed protein product [Lactuca virosa]